MTAKRGWRGARDQKELDRRQAIRNAFMDAFLAGKRGDFWKIMRIAGIPDDDPQIPELYEMWCELFDAKKPNKP